MVAGIGGLLALALIATLAIVVGSTESPPSGQELLVRMNRFVDDAESVEYHSRSKSEYSEPDAPGFVDRFEADEAAEFPNRSRSRVTQGDVLYETVTIDGTPFSRAAADAEELDRELWRSQTSPDEAVLGPVVIPPFGTLVPPEQLPELLHTARRPRLLGRGDGQSTLSVTLRFDAFEFSPFIEPRVEIVVRDSDGRPVAMRLSEGDEFGEQAAAVTFERWNGDVGIDEPTGATLDPTPAFDEERIQEYDAAALFQPRVIPQDWMLESALVLFGAQTPEGCDQISLAFADQDQDEFGYLTLYLFPESCAEGRPPAVDDFSAGEYSGWFEGETGYVYGEIVVGETTIQFDTDLRADDLAEILSDLVPLDLDNPPVPSTVFA